MNNKGIGRLKMVQETDYRWRLMTEDDHVIVESIDFPSAYKAEEWLKNYISTWVNWQYRMILKGGKNG